MYNIHPEIKEQFFRRSKVYMENINIEWHRLIFYEYVNDLNNLIAKKDLRWNI